jgi:hypothetical protein
MFSGSADLRGLARRGSTVEAGAKPAQAEPVNQTR